MQVGCNLFHPTSTITNDPEPRKTSIERKFNMMTTKSLGTIMHNGTGRSKKIIQDAGLKSEKGRETLETKHLAGLMKTISTL